MAMNNTTATTNNTTANHTSATTTSKLLKQALNFILTHYESNEAFEMLLKITSNVSSGKHSTIDAIELHQMVSGKKIFLIHKKSDQSNFDWTGFFYLSKKDGDVHYNERLFKAFRDLDYSYEYEYKYTRMNTTQQELCDLANIRHKPDIDDDQWLDEYLDCIDD